MHADFRGFKGKTQKAFTPRSLRSLKSQRKKKENLYWL
jgi:hypothetical protein